MFPGYINLQILLRIHKQVCGFEVGIYPVFLIPTATLVRRTHISTERVDSPFRVRSYDPLLMSTRFSGSCERSIFPIKSQITNLLLITLRPTSRAGCYAFLLAIRRSHRILAKPIYSHQQNHFNKLLQNVKFFLQKKLASFPGVLQLVHPTKSGSDVDLSSVRQVAALQGDRPSPSISPNFGREAAFQLHPC
jgi:hypothetical protein